MTESPAPRKSRVVKWLLIGCGGLVLLMLLCMGGCFGLAYWAWQSMSGEVTPVAASYLKGQTDVTDEIGDIVQVTPIFLGSIVSKTGNTGVARLNCEVRGSKGAAKVTVWLQRSGGAWEAVGAEGHLAPSATSTSKRFKVGVEVEMPRSRGWDD